MLLLQFDNKMYLLLLEYIGIKPIYYFKDQKRILFLFRNSTFYKLGLKNLYLTLKN